MTPYLELTHMAESARELPQKMQDKDMEVRVFMPRFGVIKERKHRLHEVIRLSGINIPVGEDDNPLLIKVASLPTAKMQIYFLDNEDFFNKRGFFGDEGKDNFYEDNDERVIFFNKGIIEIIHKLGWVPDIIHCQGWMCGLMPMYARTIHRNESIFKNTKIIYTAFENMFEDKTLGTKFVDKAIMGGQDAHLYDHLLNPSIKDFYATGIKYADGVTFGSPDVDPELVKMAYDSNKPVMPFHHKSEENFAELHIEFYQNLLAQNLLEQQH
jgi:starch synthase